MVRGEPPGGGSLGAAPSHALAEEEMVRVHTGSWAVRAGLVSGQGEK